MRVTRSADGETHARDRREYRGDGGARAVAVAVAADIDRATAAFRRSVDEVFRTSLLPFSAASRL